MTLMAEFAKVDAAASSVSRMLSQGCVPRCAELLDAHTLAIMKAAGHAFSDKAGALLILEVDGDEATLEPQALRLADHCEAMGAITVSVAQSTNQQARIWQTRSEMSRAVRQYARHKLSEDVVVPRQQLCKLLQKVDEISETESVRCLTYGHAGDGNMHVNFLWDTPDEKPRVERAVERLFNATVALGGTLSGEHGIGATKARYLNLEQSSELIELQCRLKNAFDPQGLLNPGKVFPRTGHGPC
jgi:glycolate oxidase